MRSLCYNEPILSKSDDFIKRSRLQSTWNGKSVFSILVRKIQNGKCNVRNVGPFFFGMNSDVPVFKIHVFQGDFRF